MFAWVESVSEEKGYNDYEMQRVLSTVGFVT